MRLSPSLAKRLTLPWVALLLAVSLQPVRYKAAGFHRPLHLVAFALTASLLYLRAFPHHQAAASLASVLVLAFAIELAQARLYHNPIEWWDIRDDLLGALIGLACGRLLASSILARRTNETNPG